MLLLFSIQYQASLTWRDNRSKIQGVWNWQNGLMDDIKWSLINILYNTQVYWSWQYTKKAIGQKCRVCGIRRNGFHPDVFIPTALTSLRCHWTISRWTMNHQGMDWRNVNDVNMDGRMRVIYFNSNSAWECLSRTVHYTEHFTGQPFHLTIKSLPFHLTIKSI